MLSIKLDAGSERPLIEQVYLLICKEIEQGHIRPGERLPSRRELAEQLKVSTTTVETVYEHLLEEGICESRPRSGLYVLDAHPAPAAAVRLPEVPVRWDFGTGAMDPAQFPYSTWAKLMRIVLTEQSDELLRTGDPQGSRPLRREIAKMIQRLRGFDVDPERIVLAAGTDILVAILITLIGRERLFAVEDPGYSRARRILIAGGARIAPISLTDGAINVRELYQTGAGAAYVTPGRQFPTGQEMAMDGRERLMRWANETGAYVLEDDYEGEFTFSDSPLPPLAALDTHERVVYINTFARTLAPGLRISYMILPGALRDRYCELYSACSVPGSEQSALEKFISGGYFERHIKRMRQIYRERRNCLTEHVARLHLGELHRNNAGLFELLSVNSGMSSEQLVEKARQAGVRLTALSDYSILPDRAEESGTVLLGLAGMDTEQIRDGLETLKSAWQLD